MSLVSRLSELTQRISGEFNALRSEVASAIAGKANASHTHAISEVTNLQTNLNGKYNTTGGNLTGKATVVTSQTISSGAGWPNVGIELQATNAAGQNPGISFHAPGSSAVGLWHVRGTQRLEVQGNNNVIDTANGVRSVRNVSLSTGNPTGGSDGDVWLKYS